MHSSIRTALIAIAAIGVLVMLVLFVRDYGRLPEIVPTHFGATGEPNAWGPKSTFIIFPIIAIAMFGAVIAISTFGLRSRRGPVPPALPALACLLFAESIWMLTFAEMGSFAVALGQATNLGWGFFIGLGVEMATALAIVIAAIAASVQKRT
jgi:uncharacterized membrane protein